MAVVVTSPRDAAERGFWAWARWSTLCRRWTLAGASPVGLLARRRVFRAGRLPWARFGGRRVEVYRYKTEFDCRVGKSGLVVRLCRGGLGRRYEALCKCCLRLLLDCEGDACA